MGSMEVREFIGLLGGFLLLAGLAVIVVNGGDSAKVLTAGANGFSNMVRASTSGGR